MFCRKAEARTRLDSHHPRDRSRRRATWAPANPRPKATATAAGLAAGGEFARSLSAAATGVPPSSDGLTATGRGLSGPRLVIGRPVPRLAPRVPSSPPCRGVPSSVASVAGDPAGRGASDSSAVCERDALCLGPSDASPAVRSSGSPEPRRVAGPGAHTDANAVYGGRGCESPLFPLPHDQPSTSPSPTTVEPAPLPDQLQPPPPSPRQ
jgi:hypothetical protein